MNLLSILRVLTPRERLVAQHIADYRTPTEIAQQLHVTVRTIYNYEQSIREKLSVESRPAMIKALQPMRQLVDSQAVPRRS